MTSNSRAGPLDFNPSASTAERSVPTAQMKMKRARLADDLNEKIALRPGPLELVEKNILPVDSAVKEAIKGN